MSDSKLEGYRGFVFELLGKAKASIGDHLSIKKDGNVIDGILLPHSEFSDDKHIQIKIRSGYNIGVSVDSSTTINVIKAGSKPKFIFSPPKRMKEKLEKVVIISTGGTIASRVDYRTGAVEPALSANDLYAAVPELSNITSIDTKILYNELSENITPNHWSEMATSIAEMIEKDVNGIVLCHGTDTMAYTSAALSFALQNLSIPIVIVGSQRSSDRPSSDAASNLIGAVSIAKDANFAEVVVAMHDTISDGVIAVHRGTRVRKCHTSRRDAFQTINSPIFAKLSLDDGKLEINEEDYFKRDRTRKVQLKPDFNEKVALIKFHPGMDLGIIEWITKNSYSGIIIEGTGLGHVGHYIHDSIKKAIDSGLLVGMTSQCIWGQVNMNVYYTGRDLLALGVLPLNNILSETALVKMMWAFGQTNNTEMVKEIMLKNLAGEFTPRTVWK
jgi:glutamyl-tRNA(Gln) amidotransferase subunit D